MLKLNVITIAFLVTFIPAKWALASIPYRMDYPKIDLKKGERIVSIQIQFHNVSIRSISNIQPDWSVRADLEIQPNPVFYAECGHGAGALESSGELPVITVESIISSTKPIEAVAILEMAVDSNFTKTRKLKLTLKGLKT